MPLWLKVALRKVGASREVEASAKVNTGFTIGPRPFIRLPRRLVEELGFDLSRAELMPGISDAGGRALPVYWLGPVEVRVVVPDRITNWVRAIAVFTGAPSILLNDVLTARLKIAIEDPEVGLWRFRDEPLNKLRESVKPELY